GDRLFESELLFTEPLCVPEDPQRVAFIDELVGLVPVLGVESVSRSIYFDLFNDDFPNAFSQEQIDSMTDIGHPRAAEAETVLLSEPDLIISGNYWEDANKFLPDIAPTVIWDWDVTNDWSAYFLELSELLGKGDVGQEVMDGIDARMASLEAEIGETDETYVVVRTMDELDSIQVFTTYNFGAEHVAKVGLTMPDAVLTPDEAAEVRNAWWYPLSVEALQDLDADHIFMLAGWEAEVQEAFMANPLWQTLEAVQNDQVHFIEGEYWVRTHPIASHRIIDDIFTHVAGVDAAEVAPNPYAFTYDATDSDAEAMLDPAITSGPISELPRTVVDYEGNEVVIEDDSVVIPVDGPLTEIVFALGMGDKVVASDSSSTYPPEVADLPQVGYVRRLSSEPILALAPTLILTTDDASPPEAIDQLRESGVTVVQFTSPANVEESKQLVRDVAAALGVVDRGEALVAKMEADLATAAELLAQVESTPRVMMIYARGVDTVSAAGFGTSVDVMFELAGVENAVTDWEGYQPLTAEGAVTISPDALLLFESGLESVGGPEGLLGVPGIAETPAGADVNIHAMDGLLLTGLGPRVGEAVIQLIEMLHPELQ
ncbi:MAG: ABC transporter substrate-binding protein, partial [Chloroflexota bacterium]